MKAIQTVVVGGGQAGLAMSRCLSQQGSEHIVLERAGQAGHAWRDKRWDSFCLLTPNWSLLLPGYEYSGPAPDAFMARADIVALLEAYESQLRLPVEHNTAVEAVAPLESGGYRVVTDRGEWSAQNVVIATGLFQTPKRMRMQAQLSPGIHQVHCAEYRNPPALPKGGVLVIGSAQSGCQIAEELLESGREVWLSVGTAGRLPRRYRGKDITVWLNMLGFFDRTPRMLASPRRRFAANPHMSGTRGGHSLNIHLFARGGMHLLGRVITGEGYRIRMANDLEESLTTVDAAEVRAIGSVDDYIRANGITAPEETLPHYRDGFARAAPVELDLKKHGISTIVWAHGFDFDYTMVKLPVTDIYGFPVTQGGITDFAGLYFLGMPFLSKMKSGLFLGVGEDARRIADHINGHSAL